MSEQPPDNQAQIDEQFNQLISEQHYGVPQFEIDAAHEVALARDHHETNAARALASMRLVEKAMAENPNDIGGHLEQELQTAFDSQAPAEVSTYERNRNIGVARHAYDGFSHQKSFEDDRARRDIYNPTRPGPEARDRAAADFTVGKLRGAAFSAKMEADNAEHRLKNGS